MANAPIRPPELKFSYGTTTPAITLSGISGGGNTFYPQQFVKLSGSAPTQSIASYVADDTAIFGLTPDGSHATTDGPQTQPYGDIHNVRSLRGSRFLVNITDASGTIGSGSTRQQEVSIGTLYSGTYFGSPYTTVFGLDASDTGTSGKHIFRVVEYWPEDATSDFNGRVVIEVLSTAIQG